jgi:hypothetical protein
MIPQLTSIRNSVTEEAAEWWWCLDDSLPEIARELLENRHVVLDGFLLVKEAEKVQAEITSAYRQVISLL